MKTLISLVALLLLSTSASAISLCKDGEGLACVVNAGDVLAGGIVVPAAGNDTEALVEAAILSATGVAVDISLYGKSDDNPELFTFSSLNPGPTLEQSFSGSWATVDGTLISYITVKAATSFIVEVFALPVPSSSGTFSTLGIFNRGGQQPAVSHISFWTTQGADIPEPATATLLLGSLLGVGALRRKS